MGYLRKSKLSDLNYVCQNMRQMDRLEGLYQTGQDPEDALRLSYLFGKNELEDFLERNNINVLVRAHQVVEDGYEFYCGRKLITIFSAPKYCGEFDNKGAIMKISPEFNCSFEIFE